MINFSVIEDRDKLNTIIRGSLQLRYDHVLANRELIKNQGIVDITKKQVEGTLNNYIYELPWQLVEQLEAELGTITKLMLPQQKIKVEGIFANLKHSLDLKRAMEYQNMRDEFREDSKESKTQSKA